MFLYPKDKKAYMYDPNGNFGMLLQYHTTELDKIIKDLGYTKHYLDQKNCNLIFPINWKAFHKLILDPMGFAHYALGARRNCAEELAKDGYCYWISLYMVLEILTTGDHILDVIKHINELDMRELYLRFESLIAFVIKLYTLRNE